MTTAIFPGSFDPFHNGHYEIVERAQSLFDKVVVAVLRNAGKAPAFDEEKREQMIRQALEQMDRVEVIAMSSLVVDVARNVGANVIVRGLRAVSDYENELQMAQMNRELSGIETLFIPAAPSYSFLSSRLIREIASYGGDVSAFVPSPIAVALKEHFHG